jgi:phosphate uptake regulator
MKRKVAQIGPSTLMVSLPNKWVKKNNVSKGDELDVSLGEKEINFSFGERKEKEKKITLDISGFNKHILGRYLETLYITNYNKITLMYSKPEIYDGKNNKNINILSLIKKKMITRFIGMEIVSQTKNRTELRCFLTDKEENINIIEKRIFFLFKEVMEEYLKSIGKDFHLYAENAYDYHDNVCKFITYFLRVLDKSDKSQEEKAQLFTLYLIVDKMMDKYRHLVEKTARFGCTLRVKNILQEIFELVYEHFLHLHKGSLEHNLTNKRYELIKRMENINFGLNELKVINEVSPFLDCINDFVRATIIRELGKNKSESH